METSGLEEENRQQHDNGDHDRGTDRPEFDEGLIRFLVRWIIHSFRDRVRQFAMIRHVKLPSAVDLASLTTVTGETDIVARGHRQFMQFCELMLAGVRAGGPRSDARHKLKLARISL